MPPPFLYARHCVSFDRAVDWSCRAQPCRGDGTHAGAPDGGATVECSSQCPRPAGPPAGWRAVPRGVQVRLQVFRRADGAGWALRTLAPLGKGQFLLEYVGEHVSQPEAARRADGSCILPLPRRGHAPSTAGIDALHARNAAGFVNFACAPNMAARGVLSEHWDAALPHVAFFARRATSLPARSSPLPTCRAGILRRRGAGEAAVPLRMLQLPRVDLSSAARPCVTRGPGIRACCERSMEQLVERTHHSDHVPERKHVLV